MVNVRGQLVPVVEARALLSGASTFASKPAPLRASDSLLILRRDAQTLAVVVNGVRDVIPLELAAPQNQAQTPLAPELWSAPSRPIVAAIAVVGDEIAQILPLDALFDGSAFGGNIHLDSGDTAFGSDESDNAILRERAAVLSRTSEESGDASAQTTTLHLAAVALDGEYFGFELGSVREFAPLRFPAPVPCSSPLIAGLMNLRGEILTLLDLKLALGMPASPPAASDENSDKRQSGASTLQQIKVNGPFYNRIVAGKDVIADVLPPPNYIIESYLLTLQLLDAPSAAQGELIARGQFLRAQYDERHQFWQNETNLAEPQAKQALLVEAHTPALEFFRLRDLQLIPALRRGARARALVSGPMRSSYNRHRAAIDRVVSLATTYNAATEKEAREVIARRTLWMQGLGLGLVGVLGLGLGTGLSRSISRTLRDTVGALSTTSTQMATTVEEQERTALVQSAAVHQTTTTMDELDASFTQTAEMVKIAADTAQHTVCVADEGIEVVRQTLDGMHGLKSKVSAVSEQISDLSEQISQIGTITRSVGELANQTHMLALNAAVEAARSGEHGKGFAVVAAEIRKLADESKKSAARIHTLVEDIRRATDATVMATEAGTKSVDADIKLAEQTARAFNGIVASSNSALEAAQQTLLAVPQQVAAVRQVLAAMEDLNRGARETAEGLGQTRASVDHLHQAAFKLKAMV